MRGRLPTTTQTCLIFPCNTPLLVLNCGLKDSIMSTTRPLHFRVSRVVACTLVNLFMVAGWPQSNSAQTNDHWRLETGPLKLDFYVSKTAHLFHVADQVSQWSEFCHRQYVSYFDGLDGGLSEADRGLLAQHVEVRKAHSWGGGLEQTFYTSLDLEPALAQGVKAGWLTAAEAETERRVLNHFRFRVERLLATEQPTLERFVQQVTGQRSNLLATASKLSRFVGGATLTVPVFLIANPDDTRIGGGYNGRRLTLEVARQRDVYPTLLHELFHAFIQTQQQALEKAVRSAPGLDSETLSEGLAYAFNPGLVRADEYDSLLATVSDYLAKGSRLSDSYARFNLYGLALRPLLKQALTDPGQTLEPFLARAIDAWRVLGELDKARGSKPQAQARDYRKDPQHSVFMFGLWDEQANRSLTASSSRHLFGRNHREDEYQKMLAKHAKPDDTIILLLSLDDPAGRVPAAYADLLPIPWPEAERQLKEGKVLFERGKAREMTVFLLAAPTAAELRKEFRRLATEKKFSP